MIRSRSLLLVVVSLLVCASMALAQAPPVTPPPPPGPGGPPPGQFQPPFRGPGMAPPPGSVLGSLQPLPIGMLQTPDMGLTADQLTQLRDASKKSMDARMPLFQKSRDANDALRKAISAPDYDPAKVQPLLKQAQDAENALVKQSLEEWVDLHKILTKDQMAKVADMMSQQRPRRAPGPGGPYGMEPRPPAVPGPAPQPPAP